MWRQAAVVGAPAAQGTEGTKVQTLGRSVPVVAVAPKMRGGRNAQEGVASLAIDFDALDSA